MGKLKEIADVFRSGDFRSPVMLLILMSISLSLSFATWQALLNNFVIERASFTGAEIGILQSLREIPGFLAFTAVFILLLMREQTIAYLALLFLGVGTAITGFFPHALGLYVTTVIMSIGFHYFETLRQSLAIQWTGRDEGPIVFGKMLAAGSFASLCAFGLIWLGVDLVGLDMKWVYAIGGGLTILIMLFCWLNFPRFEGQTQQHKHIVIRGKYWLFYALTFMSGARRQIFMVFAGFLMVEKFGFDVGTITLIFLANQAANMWVAPKIGRLIIRFGERNVLVLEYIGLIFVFTGYAFVDAGWMAIALYFLDHLFFAMAIALKTYFQKIADPADIASTAGVSFTISHIAAVVIPVVFGLIWLQSPALVFLVGAGMVGVSLGLAFLVPSNPTPDNVATIGGNAQIEAAE